MTPRAWTLLLAVACLYVGYALRQKQDRDTELVRLAHVIHTKDSVYVRDTIVATRTLVKYATLRDTVLATHTDTVVREFVAQADSTIRACRVVVGDCEARVAARDSLITVLRKNQPKFLDRIGVTTGLGCALGASGRSACGIIVGGSIKLWP